VSEAETDEMSKLAAMGRALGWGMSAVAFGLLPVWTSLLLPKINSEISFSEIELLESGSIIIFAITLTISVLVDYNMSRFRYRSRSIAIWFNVFFPFAICVCGMLIHIATISTKSEVLNVSFVLRSNISITIFAVLFCLFQKVLLVYEDEQGTTS
jgi:predicted membrane protein